MTYVDGCVIPVPTARREDYLRHSRDAAAIFKQYGALKVVECWGDDVPEGKLTSFPMAVKCEPGETVCLSWILWPSKAVRDAGMARVMADPRMHPEGGMPFDGKRMIFAGFEMVVDV